MGNLEPGPASANPDADFDPSEPQPEHFGDPVGDPIGDPEALDLDEESITGMVLVVGQIAVQVRGEHWKMEEAQAKSIAKGLSACAAKWGADLSLGPEVVLLGSVVAWALKPLLADYGVQEPGGVEVGSDQAEDFGLDPSLSTVGLIG